MRRATNMLLLVAVLLTAGTAVCDEETAKPQYIGGLSFVDEVEITVVSVDVIVRDKRGRPVTGLGREDFRITQDDIEMPISNFAAFTDRVFTSALLPSEVGIPDETAAPEVAAHASQIKPIYQVLYIDNENLHPMERNRVLRRLREYVTENLHEPVQMMVIAYQRSFEILQPFTDNPVEINRALRDVQTYTGGRVDTDSTRADLIDRMKEADVADYGRKGPSTREGGVAGMRQEILAFAREEANKLSFTLGSLRQVVEMLAGVEGRKSIVYVSNGLPMTPGLGLMHEYAITFHDNSIMASRSQFERMRDFKSLTSAANAQDVTFYALDAEGLAVRIGGDAEDRYGEDPTASSIGASNYQSSLRYLAERTGGIAVVNTNDVSGGLEKIRDDLFTFYSIGYTVSRVGRDKIHRIEVEIPDCDGCELRFRRRHVEKSIETRVQDTVLSSLVFEIDDNPMHLRVEKGASTPGTGDRWVVPLHLSFPLRKVALIPEGEDYVGRVVLYFGARSDDGKESDLQRQEHVIRVAAEEYEAVELKRFGIDLKLLMGAGKHRVTVGVLDPITRQDSYQRIAMTNP